MYHNHPSGKSQPGESDLALIIKITEADVMDIQLLDHLIIVPEGMYYSMAGKGSL
jgi:DNA repair protein RadC